MNGQSITALNNVDLTSINGVTYSPPVPPPLRWAYCKNTGQSFNAPSGQWTNVGIGGVPIETLSGMTAQGSYTIAIQFSCWIDNNEPTGACYLKYYNGNTGTSFNSSCLYTSTRPCPALSHNSTYGSSANTQFNEYL